MVYLRFSIDSDRGLVPGEFVAELRRLGGEAVDPEDAVGEEGGKRATGLEGLPGEAARPFISIICTFLFRGLSDGFGEVKSSVALSRVNTSFGTATEPAALVDSID